jgi:ubiquinone/menaquinone biosynthesis C-methylase UbiE
MFNICTSREDWTADNFFANGRSEVDRVIDKLRDVLPERERALDFGCGVGRCTQALAHYFRWVVGVDISQEMVNRARSLNGEQGVSFTAITKSGPALSFGDKSFDLVYSTIVLQHMPHELQRGYVKEFVRVLKPEGVASLQIPTGPEVPHGAPWLSMYGTPSETVGEWATEAGGVVLGDDVEGQDGNWVGHRYTIGRA